MDASFTKTWEGFAKALPRGLVQSYWDAIASVWTIGYGSTGPDIRKGTVWTNEQAERWLELRLLKTANGVIRACPPLAARQDALLAITDFAYNCGLGAFQTSTLRRLILQNRIQEAADELLKWDKSRGKRIAGLSRRRMAERILFLRGFGKS